MERSWTAAVVGATGATGNEILRVMEERGLPVGEMRLFGSRQSEENFIEFQGNEILVAPLAQESFQGVDIAFFTDGPDQNREICLTAALAGAVCIDLSGAWAMDRDVPLVVPEVNPGDISRYVEKRIIANPNRSTIQMTVALKPLHDHARIRRIVVATYQAVSDRGGQGIDELRIQAGELLNGRSAEVKVFPGQIGFNCLPHIGPFLDNGYSLEEMRMMEETGRVMGDADLRVTATAVQVPVFFGNGAAVNIETERKISPADAREILAEAPGISLVDSPSTAGYPTPFDASGQDQVLVGRIREDATLENGLNLWLCADNLRKGSATNALQIAEILLAEHL